jgi:hypothetical protein
MFPDRIGHMVLDGVLDAKEYYHDSAYILLPFSSPIPLTNSTQRSKLHNPR